MSLESFQHRKSRPSSLWLLKVLMSASFSMNVASSVLFYCSARKLLRLYHTYHQHKTHRLVQKVTKVRGLLNAIKVAQLSFCECGRIWFGVVCAAAGMLVDSRQ